MRHQLFHRLGYPYGLYLPFLYHYGYQFHSEGDKAAFMLRAVALSVLMAYRSLDFALLHVLVNVRLM